LIIKLGSDERTRIVHSQIRVDTFRTSWEENILVELVRGEAPEDAFSVQSFNTKVCCCIGGWVHSADTRLVDLIFIREDPKNKRSATSIPGYMIPS
jgi:hypothetical protein